MTIHFRNTFRDMLAFARYHHIRNWFVWVLWGIVLAITTAQTIQSVPPQMGVVGGAVFVIFTELLVACLWVAIVSTIVIVYMAASRTRNKTFLTEHTLTLTPEGVTAETPFATMTHTWAGIVRVARTSNHLFLYIAHDAAHIVPRRAVASQGDWDRLYEYVCRATAAGATQIVPAGAPEP
jgi:hypothetical protein